MITKGGSLGGDCCEPPIHTDTMSECRPRWLRAPATKYKRQINGLYERPGLPVRGVRFTSALRRQIGQFSGIQSALNVASVAAGRSR